MDNACKAAATFKKPTFSDNCGIDASTLTGPTSTTLEFTTTEAKTLKWSAQDTAARTVKCTAVRSPGLVFSPLVTNSIYYKFGLMFRMGLIYKR